MSTDHRKPFLTNIKSSFPFHSECRIPRLFLCALGKPSVSHPLSARHLSLQTVWNRQSSLPFHNELGQIYAGSLSSIKVAMVTPGLYYLDFGCAGCRGNNCFASSVICQKSSREAQNVEMPDKKGTTELREMVGGENTSSTNGK